MVNASHLDNFKSGCSRLQGRDSFNEFSKPSNCVGRDSSGHPLANDQNGSCYWTSKNDMNDIWKYHDSNIGEHELGFNKGDMRDGSFYRIDCDAPPNQRIASGYEQGANDNFTGNVVDKNGNYIKDSRGHNIVDQERYNGQTSGGINECVSDKTSLNDCSVKGPRTFNDPNELSRSHCKKADKISQMAEGEKKEATIQKWNEQASKLDKRMSGEQDYLSRRSAEHQRRMNQFEPGSIEYNRAKNNKDWCDNYIKQLGESRNSLAQNKNKLNTKVDGTTPSNPSKEAFDPKIEMGITDAEQAAKTAEETSKAAQEATKATEKTITSGIPM